jgi:hypothetical protein
MKVGRHRPWQSIGNVWLVRRDFLQIYQRPAERLIRSAELHIGLRDFDDDILIAAPKCRLKLDGNFEIWTVLTDKCFSQYSRWCAFHPERLSRAFRPENLQDVPSRHARLYGLHSLQDLFQPSCVVSRARARARRLQRSNESRTSNNDG